MAASDVKPIACSVADCGSEEIVIGFIVDGLTPGEVHFCYVHRMQGAGLLIALLQRDDWVADHLLIVDGIKLEEDMDIEEDDSDPLEAAYREGERQGFRLR